MLMETGVSLATVEHKVGKLHNRGETVGALFKRTSFALKSGTGGSFWIGTILTFMQVSEQYNSLE